MEVRGKIYRNQPVRQILAGLWKFYLGQDGPEWAA